MEKEFEIFWKGLQDLSLESFGNVSKPVARYIFYGGYLKGMDLSVESLNRLSDSIKKVEELQK